MKSKSSITTSDDILGKDVIDSDGEIIGVSTKIHIDNRTKQITGLTVDQGFMKPDIYIGLEYIKTFGVDSVLLNTSPKSKVRGLNVLDSYGKKIGVVADVISTGKTNRIKGIIVRENAFSKQFIIRSRDMKEIGHSVILKEDFSRTEKLR
jgi:sporulation protein YlmC with PRC-barrel domain